MKLTQIDKVSPASKTCPAETRSNNSGRYTLVSYILVLPARDDPYFFMYLIIVIEDLS